MKGLSRAPPSAMAIDGDGRWKGKFKTSTKPKEHMEAEARDVAALREEQALLIYMRRWVRVLR